MKHFRFTVGLGPGLMAAIKTVMTATNYKTVPDVVRAGTAVFVDLLDAEERNMTIILRDLEGNEWRYSPHKPGRAIPLPKEGETEAVVVTLFNSPDSNVLPLGIPARDDKSPEAGIDAGQIRKKVSRKNG